MKSILEEIYQGEGLIERIPKSEEYEKVYSEFNSLFGKLLNMLNEEQQKMLDDVFFLTGGIEYEASISHFKAGFKFCMQLVLESMGK